jgi:hypothetical protein
MRVAEAAVAMAQQELVVQEVEEMERQRLMLELLELQILEAVEVAEHHQAQAAAVLSSSSI